MRRPIPRALVAAAVLATSGAVAWSQAVDDRVRLRDGRTYRFSETRSGLRVHHGKRWAPVRGNGLRSILAFHGARLSNDQSKVGIKFEDGCFTQKEAWFSIDELDARLENTAAYRLHRKKQYKEAAAGFARAVELDGKFDTAITNLASAYALQGQVDKGEAALAPLLARKPVAAYFKLLFDPELAALRATPTVTGYKAKTRGTARLDKQAGFAIGHAAYSAERDLLAVIIHDEPGGAECTTGRALAIVDGKGQIVHRAALVRYDEGYVEECPGPVVKPSKRATVEARIGLLNQFLRDFGFEPALGEVGKQSNAGYFISKARMSVVSSRSAIRVFRRGKQIAAATGISLDHLYPPIYLPATSTLLVWWSFDCTHNNDTGYFTRLAIPPPDPPSK